MKQIALILLLFIRMAYAFPADVILAQMSKLCLKPQSFNNAIVDKDGQQFFATLELNQSGLFITKEKPVLSEEFTKKNEQVDIAILAKFLSCKGSAGLKQYLNDMGIDQTKVTYGLLNNEPVFIIGASPTDALSPQLWVQKSTFLPVKEVSQGRINIFRWIDKKFPSLIETQAGGKLSLALPVSDS